jgi:hypothetical protein
MELIISSTDIEKLSHQARTEIINLLISKGSSDSIDRQTEPKSSKTVEIKRADKEPTFDPKRPYELTPGLAKTFLGGCSDATKDFLRVFAENNGNGHASNLLSATSKYGYKTPRDFNGVLAGTTRRIRKLTKDPKAKLIEWEYDDEIDTYGGYWWVSTTTYNSLKGYFGV